MTVAQYCNSVRDGVGAAFAVSFGANACNRVCVVSGEHGYSSAEAMRRIFHGNILPGSSPVGRPSLLNFNVAWSQYFGRELLRCSYKPVAGLYIHPYVQTLYDPATDPYAALKQKMTFPAIMACLETLTAQLDMARVRMQLTKAAIPTPEEAMGTNRAVMMFQASELLIARQFLIWLTWDATKAKTCEWTRDSLGLDPTKVSGVVAQSSMQAPVITAASYLPERLKNHVQAHPQPGLSLFSATLAAGRHIVQTQGVSGLVRGFAPKTGNILFLTTAFNWFARPQS